LTWFRNSTILCLKENGTFFQVPFLVLAVIKEEGMGILKRLRKTSGFTLVEMIVILVLLGIISAVALPRFFNIDGYRTRAAYDEVAGAVRYAQKLAVASGCDVQVQIVNDGYALQQHQTSCSSGGFVNISGHPMTNNTFSNINLSPTTNFVFDSMGRSSSTLTINVGSESFAVIAETGYVDAQ